MDNAVLSQIICIFDNFLCIKYVAWGDPKCTQNDLQIFVSIIITLENGIRHLLKIYTKLLYLGQFWVTMGGGLLNEILLDLFIGLKGS